MNLYRLIHIINDVETPDKPKDGFRSVWWFNEKSNAEDYMAEQIRKGARNSLFL